MILAHSSAASAMVTTVDPMRLIKFVVCATMMGSMSTLMSCCCLMCSFMFLMSTTKRDAVLPSGIDMLATAVMHTACELHALRSVYLYTVA